MTAIVESSSGRARRTLASRAGLGAAVAAMLAGFAGARSVAADPDRLVVLGAEVARGERRELALEISESFLATEVETTVLVVRGPEPGPTLCLVGGIHGDELNGIAIVDDVVANAKPVRGTLIALPIANVLGLDRMSRYLPDRRDLNRYFPGSTDGSIAGRVAGRIWNDVIVHCSHLIDFHTGSLDRSNLPQTRGDLRREDVRALARAFGAPVVIHNPGIHGTLRAVASSHGVAALLYEAGEAERFQRTAIDAGVAGARNVMTHLGMLRDPASASSRRRFANGTDSVLPGEFHQTHWIRAPRGGLVELRVALGDDVRRGDVVARVGDRLRRTSVDVTSPRAGRVIGMSLVPLANPGTALVHLGIADGEMSMEGEMETESERPE